MATVATTLGRVGKKRRIIRRKPRTPREQFAATFRRLVGDATLQEVATSLGLSVSTVSAYRLGSRVPDFDEMPALAEKLGLASWHEFFQQE